jgi:hypothetical protein
LQNEKIDLLDDRKRIRMEMDEEYDKVKREWSKIRHEKQSMTQVQRFQHNRIKLNIGGMVNYFSSYLSLALDI